MSSASLGVRARSAVRKHWHLYLAISPFFILFFAFGIVPLFYAGWMSLHRWDGLGSPVFVGLDQFRRLIEDGAFLEALGTTLLIFLLAEVPMIVGAVVIAAILASMRARRFRGFLQTTFFLPQMTSLVMVAIVFQSLFSTDFGVVNRLLEAVGLPAVEWLANPWTIKIVIALMIIWRGFGYFLVMFLAGISAINTETYDAARVDGAGVIRIFWSITLPALRPTIVFIVIISTISGLQLFTEPQVLFNGAGGPDNAGRTLLLLQYQYLGSVFGVAILPDLGYASAISLATFAILLVASLVYYRGLRRSLDIGEVS